MFSPDGTLISASAAPHCGVLYSEAENRSIFPKKMIISADRRRRNLGELYKPTIPARFVHHGLTNKQGYFPCSSKRCDTCDHSVEITDFSSEWDQRKWKVRGHLTCSTPNVVYLIRCKLHKNACYVGSTKNLRLRWANHKSDAKLKRVNKCSVAHHVHATDHPNDITFSYLQIFAIEAVSDEIILSEERPGGNAILATYLKA